MGELREITQKKPWPELVEQLKELTAKAEKGELVAFAFVLEYTDGNMAFHAFHGGGSNVLKMLGELELAKACILQRHAESIGARE